MSLFSRKVKDDLLPEEHNPQAEKQDKVLAILKNKLVWIGVAAVVLVVLVVSLFRVLSGDKSELNYYDTMVSIFNNELGTFSYTFLVETGDKGTLIKESDGNMDLSIGELNAAENDDAAGQDSDSSSGQWNEIAIQNGQSYQEDKQFADWDKYAELKADNWQHPVYQVRIEGCTMSVDPLQTHFKVTVATPYCNQLFTEVTVRDDTYYFDVESVYNWLLNSSDDYLVRLAETIPHGSKWLTIPASEFAVPSRYAESGDEQELSEVKSLVTMYRRFLVILRTACSSVQGYLGDRGVDIRKDVVYLTLVGDDAMALLNAGKGIVTKSGDFYDAIVASNMNSGLYDETQYKQAGREKDNFIEALSDFGTSIQMCDPSTLKLQASGQVRQYINGYNTNQIEGVFGIQFSSDTTDYIVKFNGVRSGLQQDITVPDGSKTSDNAEMYLTFLNRFVDYFNFTNIKTDVKLSINPDTISDGVLDKFITLVNNTGSAGYWVTRDNVGAFIDKYKSFRDSEVKGENDIKNKLLVEDLIAALDKVVVRDTTIVPIETNPGPSEPDNTDPEQYPVIDCNINGAEVHLEYNPTDSNYNLFVVDVEVINKTEEEVVLNCQDFSLQSLMASIAPANNEVLIRGYDSTFDMSLLLNEVVMPAKSWDTFKLYFILPDDKGHMDAFYGEEQIGVLIQF